MKRIDNITKRNRGITLIEVLIAIMILFTALFFIFEIITASYSYITKTKYLAELATLTQSKVESILYENYAAETVAFERFSDQSEFVYKIDVDSVSVDNFFPNYKILEVTVTGRGPVGRNNIPEREITISTCLMDETQAITSSRENNWGYGLSPEGETK